MFYLVHVKYKSIFHFKRLNVIFFDVIHYFLTFIRFSKKIYYFPLEEPLKETRYINLYFGHKKTEIPQSRFFLNLLFLITKIDLGLLHLQHNANIN